MPERWILLGDLPRQVDGNGEADIHGNRRIENGGVDADDLALEIEERSAGIALVDGGVGLDEILVLGDATTQHAVLGAHDAHGHGLSESQRIADGQHVVAHAHLVRVADLHRPKVGRRMVDLHHRYVGRGVAAHHARLEAPLVGKLDPHLVGACHHMVVGQDHARLVDHEARAQAALGFRREGARPSPKCLRKYCIIGSSFTTRGMSLVL